MFNACNLVIYLYGKPYWVLVRTIDIILDNVWTNGYINDHELIYYSRVYYR